MVGGERLELSTLAGHAPKACAYTSSAIRPSPADTYANSATPAQTHSTSLNPLRQLVPTARRHGLTVLLYSGQVNMHKHARPSRHDLRPGTSLVDIIITLFIVGTTILVFANLLTVRSVNRRTLLRTQAAAIANEQISALKRFDVMSLANQTNGPFLGMIYNAGTWTVATDPSAGHSAPSVVQLAGATGFSNRVSGRLLLPAGSYSDATYSWKLKFYPDTAAGTAAGLLFRASDANNGYRLLVAPSGTDLDSTVAGQQNWVLEKLVNGSVITPRILSTAVAGITTNTWNTVSITNVGTSIVTFLNGNGVDSGALVDTDYTDGAAALIGWNGAHVAFDDVATTVNLVTSTWDFDSTSTLPISWVRLGLNDLPNSTPTAFDDNGLLTIATFPNTNTTTLKQATVTITWNDTSGPQSYSTSTLLGTSRVGQ